jgi:hypothetical protein
MRAFTLDVAGLPARSRPRVLHIHPGRGIVSRRAFIGGAAALGGGLIGSSFLGSGRAFGAPASNPTPNPIPGGIQPGGPGTPVFHLLLPGPDDPNAEPATITDSNGFVGIAHIQGTGTAKGPDGSTHQLLFDNDMRFQKGVYVAQDGKVHQGTFGFV